MNKNLLGIIIAIIVVLAGLYFLVPGLFTPATESPEPTVSETAVKTYVSPALGIQFQYVAKPDENTVVNVKEVGNKVYLSVNNSAPESGQSLEVFAKKADETFEASIKRQILAQYPSSSCEIEVSPSNIQGGYQVAEISYPKPTNDEEAWFANYELCNPQYDKTNGMRYFLYDPKHPDKFLFLSMGQYAIMGHDQIPWQYTVLFI